MKEPLTDELLKELLDAPNPDEYASAHKLKERTLSEYLQQLLDERGLSRAAVIREANMNATFGYQVFVGTRRASRNKVLALAFAMKLDLTEVRRLLQAAKVNGLYCKDRRDAIIIFCIHHGCSLQEVNEELYRFGEETL